MSWARSSGCMPALSSAPHHLAEAPVAQLGLDGGEQVVGIVGDLEVGVTRNAEAAGADHLHAREEELGVRRDDLLDPDVGLLLAVDGHEAADHLARHLDARDHALAALRIAHEGGEAQREAGDVRERPPDTDGERREHGQHLTPEAILHAAPRGRVQGIERHHADAVLGEARQQHVAQLMVGARGLREHLLAHAVDHLVGRATVGTALAHAGIHLIM